MKRRLLLLLLLLFSTPLLSFGPGNSSVEARKILDNLFASIDNIKTLYFKLEYRERLIDNGKFRHDSSTTKYQKLPRRIYMKMSNGAELLWGPDMNDGDVLIHPNGFPYVNLDLNPDGSLMRKNQHHGIYAAGFDYFADLIKASMVRADKDFDSRFFSQGEITYNGFKCQRLLILDPAFKFVPYTVQKGETILTIAKKLSLNEYMILKHNPKVSSYTDIKEGQSILIPTNYGMVVSLYIDETMMLPVMIHVEDEKGLFEEYDYKVLKLNPDFKSEEFSRNYKGYHF
jgi:hypothetical protein